MIQASCFRKICQNFKIYLKSRYFLSSPLVPSWSKPAFFIWVTEIASSVVSLSLLFCLWTYSQHRWQSLCTGWSSCWKVLPYITDSLTSFKSLFSVISSNRSTLNSSCKHFPTFLIPFALIFLSLAHSTSIIVCNLVIYCLLPFYLSLWCR